MKKRPSGFSKNLRSLLVGLIVPCVAFAALSITRFTSASNGEKARRTTSGSNLSPLKDPNFPKEFDVRAIHGTPRETNLLDDPLATALKPTKVQLRAVERLKNLLGVLNTDKLQIKFSGLTATPRHIFNRNGFLTEPSNLPAETIALNFIRQNRALFRFTENDLNNFKLISRATSATGTTTLVYNQQINGKTVYHGDVMVNVAKNGQILNVGGDSFPNLSVANAVTISAAQAVQNAAAALGVANFTAQSLGATQVLATYGNLPPEYVAGEKFGRGSAFTDDIVVTEVLFPMGLTARHAYKFILRTPQYYGIMWQHFVDAQTGATLRRSSLTAFQFGPPGGGTFPNRRGSFRPDVQDMVEAFNNSASPTASGKVFDALPAALSGLEGLGRATRQPGNNFQTPTYAADGTIISPGRDFQFSMVDLRHESPRFAQVPQIFPFSQVPSLLGQVVRGLPDAANPTASSPFGWFYLPTAAGGQEITTADANRTTTRALGYTLNPNALTRNNAVPGNANSPTGNGQQPFSADLTPIPSTMLADGRTLNSVFQSDYTEGNNVLAADDKDNDDQATAGVRGYATDRNFTAPHFDYYALYEFDGTAAAEASDVPPGAVNLFYVNNIIHDYMYSIGFTEQFWNFQMDNFGKGGAGGDYVVAQVQDGSGTDNANMGTPDDGGSPTMQMYRFTEDSGFGRRSDGDFDFDVIAHEHYHGVSNRSAGKGMTNCLGITLVGESGGMGEGWGDFVAGSMSDDDAAGEFVTGQQDVAIRRLPMTNYRWSYGALNGTSLSVRRNGELIPPVPDLNPGAIPFEVHDIGELWAATLWDMRELLIMKDPNGVFFDGNRRLGNGSTFYIGGRQVTSVDAQHPINYRSSFGTSSGLTPSVNPAQHIVRPALVAQEIATLGNRQGALASAVSRGARLADQLVLRGLQLTPCNPSFVEMRDAILAADRELTGGENQSIIWRAFASHGVGQTARSTGGTGGTDPAGGAQSAPVVVENFDVPAEVTECETAGPLPAPSFTLSNNAPNSVTITISAQAGASQYVIGRGTNPNGPFATIATIPGNQTSYTDTDNGDNLTLVAGQTYYYQVRSARNSLCVGAAAVDDVLISNGNAPSPAPVFLGVASVSDPRQNNKLAINWSPATSQNPNADIVYDIYRVTSITSMSGQTDSTTAPTFAPSAGNRITPAGGITGTSYTDENLTLGQVYYYIVQARDKNNGKKDSFDAGNTTAKFAAPTSNTISTTPFAIENFENASANNRFTPLLVDGANPSLSTPLWQRVTSASPSAAMFSPDFDPTEDGTGAPSDISTIIGPITLSQSSVLEFDTKFATEFGFDGGVVELAIGAPVFNAAPFPDNVTTFDLNYFIFENSYTGKLDGTLAGPIILSPLQGRFAFAGNKGVSHVRAALGSFAGGALNPTNQPVYLRFRTVSDAGTSPGAGSGLFVDNLVVNNYSLSLDIAGVVSYGTTPQNEAPKFVPDVSVAATGASSVSDTTNSLGAYLLAGLSAGGNYTVTPTKTGDVNGAITAFDATLVLRHVAAGGQGADALTANQQIAADADGDNGVTAFDATQILRFVAANGSNATTGNVGNWELDPASRPYQNLTVSFLNENYTAFLIGEVSGDWSAAVADAPARAGKSARKGRAELEISLPPDITAAPGETLEIPLTLAGVNGTPVSAFAIDVKFDSRVLRLADNPVESGGTLTANGFMISTDTTAENRIGIAAAGGAIAVNGAATLIKLRFQVVGTPKGAASRSALTESRVVIEDANGRKIAAKTNGGRFSITNSPAGKQDR